ncbi:MAG TPA: 3,4-dihydroxy-2-butanone-4-phosphate synthase [Dongiaceae bacterium]|nr:3,4-dihydroxy-2-butanone-4-phosphate synthase [Dongiaceae bacterium]
MDFEDVVSPIPELIEEARKGKMFILVDNEERENEGDLVIPAQMVTAQTVNFMAKHGRGLICLALERKRVEELGLSLMSRHNGTRHQTAFTVSIEAREGVTTGISAQDRAQTIAVAIDPAKGQGDIVTPGHIFPLVARDGGVLVRAGHTEAAVDIARLAGLNPAGAICEILNEDGTMARRDDLIRFAQFHNLKIGTISDLIAYRRRYDHIVQRTLESDFVSEHGGAFKLFVYTNTIAHAEHLVLVKGDIGGDDPVLVRMHALSILDDMLGDKHSARAGELQNAMRMIGAQGRGVIVVLREAMPTALSDAVRSREGPALPTPELRDYGIGAQILLDLGVRRMILLTNRRKTIIGLEGYDLTVVEERPIRLKPS